MIETMTKLSNVDYRGRLDPDEAMSLIADAALFLCTSDEEGFPNTFTQAWSTGTPIVTLQVDPDNIIEKMRLGEVSRTVDGAVAHIKALIASVDLREEIALRARRYISENHNEQAVIEVFNKTLGNASSTFETSVSHKSVERPRG
jgi:glycosyltransferase involved in cell wall biosynthesis